MVLVSISVAFAAVNLYALWPSVRQDLSVFSHCYTLDDAGRLDLIYSGAAPYCRFVREYTDPEISIGIPLKADLHWSYARLTQTDIMQYLLFPRRVMTIRNPADLNNVDAIVCADDFPKNYPRTKYIPYPHPEGLTSIQVCMDNLRIRKREGKWFFIDKFEKNKKLEGESYRAARLGRMAISAIDASSPAPRFQLERTRGQYEERSHTISSEYSYRGSHSERIVFLIQPWVGKAYYTIPVSSIPVKDILSLEMWVWATKTNTVRVGFGFDDGRWFVSAANRKAYCWEEIGFDDVHEYFDMWGFKNWENLKVRQIRIGLQDYNFLINTGLIVKP
jgi:hypothetical protein